MGWPDLLVRDAMVMMASDDTGEDNFVSPMNSPCLSPDANAIALNPSDIDESTHLHT
jgi:hypothetical protein